MTSTTQRLKELRVLTGLSLIECKRALQETHGDIDQAIVLMRKWGIFDAAKRQKHSTSEGVIEAYVHTNRKIGVLVELRCESDFVARTEDFRHLAHELALHIAAMNPRYLRPEDVPKKDFEELKELGAETEDLCLLTQSSIRDQTKTIQEFINEHIARFGENISVTRFVRYSL